MAEMAFETYLSSAYVIPEPETETVGPEDSLRELRKPSLLPDAMLLPDTFVEKVNLADTEAIVTLPGQISQERTESDDKRRPERKERTGSQGSIVDYDSPKPMPGGSRKSSVVLDLVPTLGETVPVIVPTLGETLERDFTAVLEEVRYDCLLYSWLLITLAVDHLVDHLGC
jgi:hypothetical protein